MIEPMDQMSPEQKRKMLDFEIQKGQANLAAAQQENPKSAATKNRLASTAQIDVFEDFITRHLDLSQIGYEEEKKLVELPSMDSKFDLNTMDGYDPHYKSQIEAYIKKLRDKENYPFADELDTVLSICSVAIECLRHADAFDMDGDERLPQLFQAAQGALDVCAESFKDYPTMMDIFQHLQRMFDNSVINAGMTTDVLKTIREYGSADPDEKAKDASQINVTKAEEALARMRKLNLNRVADRWSSMLEYAKNMRAKEDRERK